jgi:hypothetical protein
LASLLPICISGSVKVEGDIADPMETIFNRPIVAAQTEQPLWIGVVGFEAGDAKNSFAAAFLSDDFD